MLESIRSKIECSSQRYQLLPIYERLICAIVVWSRSGIRADEPIAIRYQISVEVCGRSRACLEVGRKRGI